MHKRTGFVLALLFLVPPGHAGPEDEAARSANAFAANLYGKLDTSGNRTRKVRKPPRLRR